MRQDPSNFNLEAHEARLALIDFKQKVLRALKKRIENDECPDTMEELFNELFRADDKAPERNLNLPVLSKQETKRREDQWKRLSKLLDKQFGDN